jgi:superfamily II DNA or RNA helicase
LGVLKIIKQYFFVGDIYIYIPVNMNYGIERLIPLYPNTTSEKFAETIFKKEEFYTNRTLATALPLKKGSGEKYPQQQFLANFLSPITSYNRILVYHAMGQGKTCASIAISEINKNNMYARPTLVLVRGGGGVQIFKKAIINDCNRHGVYDKSTVSKKYEIKTLQKFVNNIRFPRDLEVYSDRVIIIDEAHNIRLNPEEGKTNKKKEEDICRVEFAKIYKNIHKLLHGVKNTKVILLTGTPMRDVPYEISSLMNLILPMERQLPPEAEFNDKYINSKEGLLTNVDDLQSRFVGIVSYLQRNVDPKIKIIEMGEKTPTLTEFKVYKSYMGDIQYNAYIEAYKQDSRRNDLENVLYSAFFGNVNQSVLCVTPDGRYDKTGYNSIIKLSKSTGYANLVDSSLEKFLNSGGNDDKNRLIQLSKISCKYATIIKTILGLNPDHTSIHKPTSVMKELVFVFNNLVQKSGGVLFSLILKIFGFSQVRVSRIGGSGGGGDDIKSKFSIGNCVNYKSYAIVNKFSTPSDEKISTIIDAFNHPSNVGGKYIRVIIGSEVISEGIDLNNISQIHIATPHWNNSETEQAIARGIRIGKHTDLLNMNIQPKVSIYRHMAFRLDGIPTIDFAKYKASTNKSKLVKQVSDLMRDASVDCNLNKSRNSAMGESFKCLGYDVTNDSEYTKNVENPLPLVELNQDTGDFFYSMNNNKSICLSYVIKTLFSYRFRYYRVVLIDTINSIVLERKYPYSYSNNYIMFVLKELIDTLEPIQNPHSKNSYLKESKNTFYLTSEISSDIVSPDSIYYIYNTFKNNRIHDSKLIDTYLLRFLTDVKVNSDLSNVGVFDTYVLAEKIIKLYRIENKDEEGKMSDEDVIVLNKYKPLFVKFEINNSSHHFFVLPYLMQLRSIYVETDSGWVLDNSNDVIAIFEEHIEEKKLNTRNYYALITVDKNKPLFKIAINNNFMVKNLTTDSSTSSFQKKPCDSTNVSDIIKVVMDLDDVIIKSHDGTQVIFENGFKLTIKDIKNNGSLSFYKLDETYENISRIVKSDKQTFKIYTSSIIDSWDIAKLKKLYVFLIIKNNETRCNIISSSLLNSAYISYSATSKSNRKKNA